MNHQSTQTQPSVIRLGYWAALLSAGTFVIFTACFVAIAVSGPLFIWTDMADYVAHVQETNQVFKHLAQLCMLLFSVFYVVLVNSIHAWAPEDRKHLTRMGLSFGVMFAVLTGLHYFVQLTAVRSSLRAGITEDLAPFVQANPHSVLLAVNMLGWTLCFGLSSLFIGSVFDSSRTAHVIRIALLMNGGACLLGGVGFALEITALTFVTINLLMGGAVLVFTIALALFFRRMHSSAGCTLAGC